MLHLITRLSRLLHIRRSSLPLFLVSPVCCISCLQLLLCLVSLHLFVRCKLLVSFLESCASSRVFLASPFRLLFLGFFRLFCLVFAVNGVFCWVNLAGALIFCLLSQPLITSVSSGSFVPSRVVSEPIFVHCALRRPPIGSPNRHFQAPTSHYLGQHQPLSLGRHDPITLLSPCSQLCLRFCRVIFGRFYFSFFSGFRGIFTPYFDLFFFFSGCLLIISSVNFICLPLRSLPGH